MKKLFKVVAVAVLSLGFGVAAQAQDAVINTNMTASAEVLDALVLAVDQGIDLGNISRTTPGEVYVNPKGSQNKNVGVSAKQGIFALTGNAQSSVRFSWPKVLTLVNQEEGHGDKTMDLTLEVIGFGEKAASSGVTLTSAALQGDTWSGNATISDLGKYFLFVGGTIPALNNQQNGTYTGVALFTVEYN